MITSPYNFVPVVDTVFAPDWGDPSHDMPFKDGVSGELHVTLKAHTPIFIRRSVTKPTNLEQILQQKQYNDDTFKKWTDFHCSPDDLHYEVPATSWKGMLRNVLKVVSFGSIEEADDTFISVRDLNDLEYTAQITKPGPKNSFEAKVRGGWLSENPNRGSGASEWIITPCKIARVEQCKLKNTDPDGLEEHGNLPLMTLGRRMMSAEEKYRAWGNNLSIHFDLQSTSYSDGFDVHGHSCGRLFYAKAMNIGAATAQKTGTLVFTGQAGAREKEDQAGEWRPQSGNKHMEFIFYDEAVDPLAVSFAAQKKFLDTHPLDNKGWKYWRDVMGRQAGTVPVFWIENEQSTGTEERIVSFDEQADDDAGGAQSTGTEERIVSFGLAQMFRFPAKSVHQAIPAGHFKRKTLDLAERLFGCLGDNPLRGRIQTGPLLSAEHCAKFDQNRRLSVVVLGKPQASFYPAYLEQPEYGHTRKVAKHHTWLTPNVRIRGWKRYHVPADAPLGTVQPRHEHPVISLGSATALRPLPAGTVFSGSLRFHNLTRRELGALVWAITWGSNPDLRHSIGMGKSMGLGSCALSVVAEKSELRWHGKRGDLHESQVGSVGEFLDQCMKDFSSSMDVFATTAMQARWLHTSPMKEIHTMASQQNGDKFGNHWVYPPLRPHGEPMDFRTIKSGKHVLPRASEIVTKLEQIAQRQTRLEETAPSPASSHALPKPNRPPTAEPPIT